MDISCFQVFTVATVLEWIVTPSSAWALVLSLLSGHTCQDERKMHLPFCKTFPISLQRGNADSHSHCQWKRCPCSDHILAKTSWRRFFSTCHILSISWLFMFLISEMPILSVFLLGSLFLILNDDLCHKNLTHSVTCRLVLFGMSFVREKFSVLMQIHFLSDLPFLCCV